MFDFTVHEPSFQLYCKRIKSRDNVFNVFYSLPLMPSGA